jgi:DNA-binding NtrC family response regulator
VVGLTVSGRHGTKIKEMANGVSFLVVDDDTAVASVLRDLLEQAGVEACVESSARGAMQLLDKRDFDCVITDLRMPGLSGMELVSRLCETWPDTHVVVLTAHGSIATAVEAMQRGAADFLTKPFERDDLLQLVSKVRQGRRPSSAPPRARRAGEVDLLGDSVAVTQLREVVRKAAASSATVLITGETGTGKEVVARAIHLASARSDGPLVTVQCAALPDALLESELFGYEKGAFTGAHTAKPGRVALAQHGTLFLDEIGDVSSAVQVKLLRLLQEREYDALGGVAPRRANVRFMAATHRKLEAEVAKDSFREDLYYRLNVLPVRVPPLRERSDDIALLAEHFRATACAEYATEVSFSDEAVTALSRHAWPGNVRELKNLVERLVVLSSESVVDARCLIQALDQSEPGVGDSSQPRRLDKTPLGREDLLQVLRRSGNNRSLAARLLGVSRRTLYNRLAEFGITENPDL